MTESVISYEAAHHYLPINDLGVLNMNAHVGVD